MQYSTSTPNNWVNGETESVTTIQYLRRVVYNRLDESRINNRIERNLTQRKNFVRHRSFTTKYNDIEKNVCRETNGEKEWERDATNRLEKYF